MTGQPRNASEGKTMHPKAISLLPPDIAGSDRPWHEQVIRHLTQRQSDELAELLAIGTDTYTNDACGRNRLQDRAFRHPGSRSCPLQRTREDGRTGVRSGDPGRDLAEVRRKAVTAQKTAPAPSGGRLEGKFP